MYPGTVAQFTPREHNGQVNMDLNLFVEDRDADLPNDSSLSTSSNKRILHELLDFAVRCSYKLKSHHDADEAACSVQDCALVETHHNLEAVFVFRRCSVVPSTT